MAIVESSERKRIFVSYRHEDPDQTVARTVASALKQEHDVFIDTDIPAGSEWAKEIQEALQETDYLIAFLSEPAVASEWLVRELETAHNRTTKTGQPIIIPVRFGFNGQLPFPLNVYVNRFQYIFLQGPEDTGQLIQKLIETISYESTRRPPYTRVGRDRLRAIQRVRRYWIEDYLRQSVHEAAHLELEIAEKLDVVEWPLEKIVQRPYSPDRPLAIDTRVSTIFDDQLGQLLILGAPGSGKTILLLELARELLDRAEEDGSLPIPAVFNLSSWALRRNPLAHWLADEMSKLYDIPRRLAQTWAEREQILPLLDGLDEVALEHRDACGEAINAFRNEHKQVPIVVCSRIAEYEALSSRLRMPGAVVIQPLAPERVRDYLERTGVFNAVQTALSSDPTLWDLLDTPLMLNIVMRACQGTNPLLLSPGPQVRDLHQRRDFLFDQYINSMLHHRAKEKNFTPEQTVRWLARLASSMAQFSESVLRLGALDRTLSGAPVRMWVMSGFGMAWALYAIFIGLRFMFVYALIMGLDSGVSKGLVAGLILGIWEALLRFVTIETSVWASPKRGSRLGWYMPEKTLRSARNLIISGLAGGLVLGLSLGLVIGLSGSKLFGLVVGLLLGLMIGLLFALERDDSWSQHLILRLRLWRGGLAPWRLVHFLDYAAERLFLRKVGDGYIFVHRTLMEYFAAQWSRSDLNCWRP